jgi:hypothetical protein
MVGKTTPNYEGRNHGDEQGPQLSRFVQGKMSLKAFPTCSRASSPCAGWTTDSNICPAKMRGRSSRWHFGAVSPSHRSPAIHTRLLRKQRISVLPHISATPSSQSSAEEPGSRTKLSPSVAHNGPDEVENSSSPTLPRSAHPDWISPEKTSPRRNESSRSSMLRRERLPISVVNPSSSPAA